jgi:GMP synthase (glutamine-hydrolysing)
MTAVPDPQGAVTIIEHEPGDPPATVAATLAADGVPFEVRRLYAGDSLPDLSAAGRVGRVAGLVLMGGEMNTDQDDRYPWLEEERALIREAVRRDVPLLAICLGAQQLAAATGGRVYHRERPERGWLPVEVVVEDELFAGLPRRFEALEWHMDSFVAPPGAVVFGERRDGQQAFRVGRRAWGVQFHPEVDDELLEHWIVDAAKESEAFQEEMRARRDEIVSGSVPLCAAIVRNFVRSF